MFQTFRVLLAFSMIFSSLSLNSAIYDDDILGIFSKVMPRFVLMSSKREAVKDEINICISRDDIDEKKADLLIKKTSSNYPNGIKNIHIRFKKTNFSNIEQCKESELIFLFNSNQTNIQGALNFSHRNTILTMAYDSNILESGADVSMFLGRKVVPYININSIQKKEIVMNNNLLRISKIYNKEDK